MPLLIVHHTALLGILRSIAPEVVPEDGNKLDEEDIKKINERLVELLGKGAMDQYNQDKNERGELVNEDGLPIIEITEPTEIADVREVGTAHIADDDGLIPLASLSNVQREYLRQETEHVLDTLEEEERLEEQREKERFLEERRESIREKMKEAAKEKERAKAGKDLQKKMGKALLRAGGEESENGDYHTGREAAPSEPAKPKKCVSFAAESVKEMGSPTQEKWGGISLARLRSTNRPTLLDRVTENKEPMKRKVIERRLAGQYSITLRDSDDESNPDEEEDKGYDLDDKSSLHDEQPPQDSAPESDVTDEGLEDLDYARHQREIALEYYAKRGIIGQATAQALISHSHSEDQDEKEILADTGVTEPPSPKPSISRFKASKFASSYNASLPSQSTSLDGSVLSVSSAKTLQRAIRMGSLDPENQLVGADGESESEEETETVQQVRELLSKGELYNLGPQGDRAIYAAVPPPQKNGVETGTAAAVNRATLPPLQKPKNSTSKFKVDRSQAGLSKATESQAKGVLSTPKASTTQPTAPTVVERQPPGKPKVTSTSGASPMPPTINYPFRSPNTTSTQKQDPPSTQQPMINDSPSFMPPEGPTSLAPFSMIVESPSFPLPRGAIPSRLDTLTPAEAALDVLSTSTIPTPAVASRRPTRPPIVMSSVVREKPATERIEQAEARNALKPQVSRFLAERM
ncbi:hypothetical protein AX15_001218 [Amanita polypyramis BW_CC]|nr:hypothetical protein AX15_001218 [Amanita polypyramis BW_CC]